MKRVLMKGNEALARGAVAAGCRYFFGYPITPQNEIPTYMAEVLPKLGGVYLQAESEIGAINMIYGAAGCGKMAMTSSSGPGLSLKQEGISYLCGAELPCVIVNIQRCGPGLGGVLASQGDYFQATRGGGHGDYRTLVLAPATAQEMYDLAWDAFTIAFRYRNPVVILGDGILGQMMEPVALVERPPVDPGNLDWATTMAKGRSKRLINSLYIDPVELEQHNRKLAAKYERMKREEVRFEEVGMDDAEICVVAYGIVARIVRSAVARARAQGMKVGMIRPITLFPFPEEVIYRRAEQVKLFLTVELSTGQMVEDVRLAVAGRRPVEFYGRQGGMVPTPKEILEQIERLGAIS
ncbi:MAG TPA: 3-methyl-2-oxobutanoate dehydrogenase subunit VorB [Firmicutes bacterium]|nr:3-methyl-2-oxobutanoate dehydrogenase subunit VorB [Bacillota bacterium]